MRAVSRATLSPHPALWLAFVAVALALTLGTSPAAPASPQGHLAFAKLCRVRAVASPERPPGSQTSILSVKLRPSMRPAGHGVRSVHPLSPVPTRPRLRRPGRHRAPRHHAPAPVLDQDGGTVVAEDDLTSPSSRQPSTMGSGRPRASPAVRARRARHEESISQRSPPCERPSRAGSTPPATGSRWSCCLGIQLTPQVTTPVRDRRLGRVAARHASAHAGRVYARGIVHPESSSLHGPTRHTSPRSTLTPPVMPPRAGDVPNGRSPPAASVGPPSPEQNRSD